MQNSSNPEKTGKKSNDWLNFILLLFHFVTFGCEQNAEKKWFLLFLFSMHRVTGDEEYFNVVPWWSSVKLNIEIWRSHEIANKEECM